MTSKVLLLFSSLLALSCSMRQPTSPPDATTAIRINQLGYYPFAPKRAVIVGAKVATNFQVIDINSQKNILSGELSNSTTWELSGETVQIADFSDLQTPGSYQISVPDLGNSYVFEIKNGLLTDALKASAKSLYFQRSGFALEEAYAGIWKRAKGHPDDSVLFHPSSGKSGYQASPGGWYDAGDYGKYVVNGAFPLGQMLMLHEHYPEALGDGSLAIPESNNGTSDLLDELKYEMDWLLTMRDEDGGVFFKLTTKGFEDMVMPAEANKQRYIIGKSTSATLDFCATAAKFSRAYKEIDPAYAEACLTASRAAWNWAIDNSKVIYTNPEDVSTGEYGDKNFSQEFYWAASELYMSTLEDNFLNYLLDSSVTFNFSPGESWANYMHFLGAFNLLNAGDTSELSRQVSNQIIQSADQLVQLAEDNDYHQPIKDFQWGSNSDVLNAAMIVAQAYRITKKKKYLEAVSQMTDYIFGYNATGYSFLTGFGDKYPMYIHHRPSAGDNIEEPVPGLLSGGPNYGKHDQHQVNYPNDAPPMKCWADVEPSFASNEICLNWNAPLIYILGFLESESEALNSL